MKRGTAMVLVAVCWLGLLPHGIAQAAPEASEALAKRPDYRLGVGAMRDGLAGVAVQKFRKLRETGKLSGTDAGVVDLLLAEALVRDGRPESAAEVLEVTGSPGLASLPEAEFWRAAALARMRRWGEAEEIFGRLGEREGFRFAEEAALSRAGVLARLGDGERAIRVLQPLLDGPEPRSGIRARLLLAEVHLTRRDPAAAEKVLDEMPGDLPAVADAQRRLQRARARLMAGAHEEAAAMFAALAGSPGTASQVAAAAELGQAEALRAAGRGSEAIAVLEQLAGRNPPPPDRILAPAFRAFEALNQPPSPEANGFLTSWAASDDPYLKARARMALAAAQEQSGTPAAVSAGWEAVARDLAGNPLLPAALLRHAEYLLSQGGRDRAAALAAEAAGLAVSPDDRSWAAWIQARAAYETGRFEEALAKFTAAAEAGNPQWRTAAAFNAALAGLAGDAATDGVAMSLLDSIDTPEARHAGAELHLERALYMASRGIPGAVEALGAFVNLMPDHPRRFEALLALAELFLTREPPDPAAARAHADAAAKAAATPAETERVDFVRVFIAAAEGRTLADESEALTAATRDFLTRYPESKHRPELRMRIAALYYRRENFTGAAQQFEQVAADDPAHPLAEVALFWAGKASLLTLAQNGQDKALVDWAEVFRRNGPLKWQARLQTGLLHQRRNDLTAAREVLEGILNASPPADENTRRHAACILGEVLMTSGPQHVDDGIRTLDELASAPGIPREWRHQALVRKAVCLMQLRRHDEALEACYDVLTDPPQAEEETDDGPPDDYWFYSAGERALRILETQGKAEQSVEIARKMAQSPGPRGPAARELMNQLLLKHGIYDGRN